MGKYGRQWDYAPIDGFLSGFMAENRHFSLNRKKKRKNHAE
jgi:hypothetical protein